MAENKFFTKQGWLTADAMACGYMHVTESRGVRVRLSMNNAELKTYDVIRMTTEGVFTRQWEVVEGINAARALYKKLCKPARVAKRDRARHESQDTPARVYA